jgi:hypothetical protein
MGEFTHTTLIQTQLHKNAISLEGSALITGFY